MQEHRKTGGARGTNQHAVRTPGTGLRPEQRHGPEVLARLAGGDDADIPWDADGAVEPEGTGHALPWLAILALCGGGAIVLVLVLLLIVLVAL
jgi:hypothetical protein